MGRYAVFIDGGYFKKVLESFGYPKISYLLLSENVRMDDERLRTYYYDCPPFMSPTPSVDERRRQSNFDKFIHEIETYPRFQTRLGRLARYQTIHGVKFIQKKVDVLLAVDLVRLSCEHQIQRAILIAGDSDFVPAIEIAKDAGTIVQLYFYNNPKPHDELIKACDENILIDKDFIQSIELKKHKY